MPGTKTQAWIVRAAGDPFSVEDIVLDDPLEDEVLVEMVASGICHTDISVAKGLLPGSDFPVILGHEGSGRVVSTGSKVTNVSAGDAVLLSFAFCNECQACKDHDVVACDRWFELNFLKKRSNGSSTVGHLSDGTRIYGSFFGQSSFSKISLVRATSCVKVPIEYDLELLAPLGCGQQTGAGAVLNIAKPSTQDSVLIAGLGGVGMAALMACASLGLKTVIAVDLIESRLELAKDLGATHTINAREVDTTEEALRLTNGQGVKFAIECTGVPKVAKGVFEAVGKRGTMVQVGDCGIGELSIKLGSFLSHLRSIVGCAEGDSYPPEFVPRLATMHAEGKFPLEAISKKYNWMNMAQAELDMHHGTVIKPILVFD